MNRLGHSERHPVDAPSAIAAASYLIGLNMLIVNIQPLVLGALATGYGFTDRQLGHVSAVFVGFNTLATLSAPLWVRRLNWRIFSMAAVTAATLVLASGLAVREATSIFGLFALLGLLKGCVGAPSFASLGDTSNPDRSYGVSVVVQSSLSAVAAIPVSAYVIPRFGVPGLFLSLAIVLMTGLVACRWLPIEGRPHRVEQADRPTARVFSAAAIPALVATLGLALFGAGILAFWYFDERIGAARGASSGLIGAVVGGDSVATIMTAAIAAWFGGRLPSLVFVAGGTALVLSGLAVLEVPGDAAYAAANLAFAMGWGLGQPAFWAILRKVDVTNRLFVGAPAVGGAAGVSIGIMAGPIIEWGGYDALILFSAVLVSSATICLTLAVWLVVGRLAPWRS